MPCFRYRLIGRARLGAVHFFKWRSNARKKISSSCYFHAFDERRIPCRSANRIYYYISRKSASISVLQDQPNIYSKKCGHYTELSALFSGIHFPIPQFNFCNFLKLFLRHSEEVGWRGSFSFQHFGFILLGANTNPVYLSFS